MRRLIAEITAGFAAWGKARGHRGKGKVLETGKVVELVKAAEDHWA